MQVMVLINDAHLSTLLDSGLTHNFMDPAAAAATHAGLLLTKLTRKHVAIANGNRVHSPDYCRHLRIMICGKHFSIDLLWTVMFTSQRVVLDTVSADLMDELLTKFTPLFIEPSGLLPPRPQSDRI
jgi:hypothetical protein